MGAEISSFVNGYGTEDVCNFTLCLFLFFLSFFFTPVKYCSILQSEQRKTISTNNVGKMTTQPSGTNIYSTNLKAIRRMLLSVARLQNFKRTVLVLIRHSCCD